MFNRISRQEAYELQKRIDDLERNLRYEQRERTSDAVRIEEKSAYEAHAKRLEHIEARYKAEAEASACKVGEKLAAEYAQKAVEMAAKCASDFAEATGKMQENFLSVIKELKPAESKFTVLPTQVNNDCRKEGGCIKM